LSKFHQSSVSFGPMELPLTTLLRLSASLSSIVRFSSLSVGVDGGLREDIG